MQTVKVPLANDVVRNVDGKVVNDRSFTQYNGYVDELGGINVRPGMTSKLSLSDSAIGLYHWNKEGKILCVDASDNINLYTITSADLTAFSTTTSTTLGFNRPTFCTDGTYVFFANGGQINYIDSAGVVTTLADADAPTEVSHVAFLDSYILANEVGTNRFWWCDPGSSLSWGGTNYASATGSPDLLTALHVVDRQIYLFGPDSFEVWYNDGSNPFSRVPGGFYEIGCVAPYSIVNVYSNLIWLDNRRRFVQSSGGEPQIISGSYDRILSEISDVSGCRGDKIEKDGQIFLTFYFPSEDRTIAYNYFKKEWCEWGTWDSSSTTWGAYNCSCSCYAIDVGRMVIGGLNDDTLYFIDSDSREDASGAPVKFLRMSGHIDYGTSKSKRSNEFRVRLRRGDVSISTTPVLMLRWRDNGRDEWSQLHELSLGEIGENDMIYRLRRTGIYRTRQYEISCTDGVPVIVADAEEDVEILR